jgi:hypothetical protein
MYSAFMVSVVLANPILSEADEAERNLVSLQGSWKLVSCRYHDDDVLKDGVLITGAFGSKSVSIKISRKTVFLNGKATFKIDATRWPVVFDETEEDGTRTICEVSERQFRLRLQGPSLRGVLEDQWVLEFERECR